MLKYQILLNNNTDLLSVKENISLECEYEIIFNGENDPFSYKELYTIVNFFRLNDNCKKITIITDGSSFNYIYNELGEISEIETITEILNFLSTKIGTKLHLVQMISKELYRKYPDFKKRFEILVKIFRLLSKHIDVKFSYIKDYDDRNTISAKLNSISSLYKEIEEYK